jgi:hypothetical protein
VRRKPTWAGRIAAGLTLLVAGGLLTPAPAETGPPSGERACEGLEIESRAIPVRYRPVDEAVRLVSDLLGPCGAYRVPRSTDVIVVEDEPERVERVAEAVASWDLPPRPVEVSISLVLASREAPPSKGLAPDIRELSDALSDLMNWSRYQRLGTTTMRAMEGGVVEAELAEDYRIAFEIGPVDPEHGIVPLEPFALYRRVVRGGAGADAEPWRKLLSVSGDFSLEEGRQHVVAAPSRGREKALILTMSVWILEPEAAVRAGASEPEPDQ